MCGGPGGDGGTPPEAQPRAGMALGISLRLPVCPSEPVIHALGRGANQLKRGTVPSRQMGTGELPGASSQRPLCVPGAQPLAGAVPARTKCHQFLRNNNYTNNRVWGWSRAPGVDPLRSPASPPPTDLDKEAARLTEKTRALGSARYESQSCSLL